MNRPKVTIVGAGNVGATCAQRIAERDYADIVLIDAVEGKAAGNALDINQAGPASGFEPRVTPATTYEQTAGSDICILAAGHPRNSGLGREELLRHNREIIASIAEKLALHAPDSVLIVVTNPLDAMCHTALETSEFPRARVVGMAGVLDTARFRTFVAWELGVSVREVSALVLGGHGDQLVAVISQCQVAGVPLAKLLDRRRIDEIVERTRSGGFEVAGLLQSGSAYYAPAAGVLEMVDSIVFDRKRVLPCAAHCQGEFGIEDAFVGVPCRLGSEGIEEIVELELEREEREALHSSARAVRELLDQLERS